MATHLQLAPVLAEARVCAETGQDSPAHPHRSIRIVLADDHALMCSSVRRLLDGEEGMEVIAEAGDLACAVRHVQAHRPCVLVLDLMLPNGSTDGSSIHAIGPLRERVPATQIVVMTMEDGPAFPRPAFAAGASGFVAKELADEELIDAVRAAAGGERYVSPRVALRMPAARPSKRRLARRRAARREHRWDRDEGQADGR